MKYTWDDVKAETKDSTMNFTTGRFAIGTGREGIENARKALASVRGRPRKGSKSAGSRARSLRLPDATWADLETLAKSKGMTVHRLLRVLIAERLYTQTWSERQASNKRKRKAVGAKAAAKVPADWVKRQKQIARKLKLKIEAVIDYYRHALGGDGWDQVQAKHLVGVITEDDLDTPVKEIFEWLVESGFDPRNTIPGYSTVACNDISGCQLPATHLGPKGRLYCDRHARIVIGKMRRLGPEEVRRLEQGKSVRF